MGYCGLLGFVEWVQEDGAVVAVRENLAEDLCCEISDPGSWYEKVEPWVWDFPQAFGPQLHLGDVNSVQELEVGDLRLEEDGRDVPQLGQQSFDLLQPQGRRRTRLLRG